jgi:hypothetical protein
MCRLGLAVSLRRQVNQIGALGVFWSVLMSQPSAYPPSASGCLSQIGLAALIACGTFLIVTLTVLLPPWVAVKSQPRSYLSDHVKEDYDQTFVGYDFLFAGPKWETLELPTTEAKDGTFDVRQYRIFWPLLVGEWVVICVAAGSLFVVLSWRMQVGTESRAGRQSKTGLP